MVDSPRPACLDPECIIPISRDTTEVFKTGTWSATRPRFTEKLSPCRAACPAGNNIVEAMRAAAKEDFDAALAAFDDTNEDNDVAAINSLNALINAVEAQRGNKISDADADMLIAETNAIINKLNSQ